MTRPGGTRALLAALAIAAPLACPQPSLAASTAPTVRQTVTFRSGPTVTRTVRAGRTTVRAGGRMCAVAAGTPLAALARSRIAPLLVQDFGRCSSASPRASALLHVVGIGADHNQGPDGWVYAVDGRPATAGSANPSGAHGRGRLRPRAHIVWTYCTPANTTPACRRARSLAPAPSEPALALASRAALPASRAAARYLRRSLNPDGGLGTAPGHPSSQLTTGWGALGLAAANVNPLQARSARRRSPISFIRSRHRELKDPGALARTILVLRASGLPPRLARRDLRAEQLRQIGPDGSVDGYVSLTAWALIALRAAGDPASSGAIQRAALWLSAQQNADGGFGYAPRAESDPDDTGAVLQALAAANLGTGPAASAAVAYLRATQNPDGGFGAHRSSPSNAMSTAWATQGLVAARADPRTLSRRGRTPLTFLLSLQRPDGSFRYSRAGRQTPVWVTSQVIPALRLKAFPLDPVPLARARPRSGSGARPRSVAAHPGRAETTQAAAEPGRSSGSEPRSAPSSSRVHPRRRPAGRRPARAMPPASLRPPVRSHARANPPAQAPPRREQRLDLAWSLTAALALASVLLVVEIGWWRRRPRPTLRAAPPPEPRFDRDDAELPDPDADAESADRELEELLVGR